MTCSRRAGDSGGPGDLPPRNRLKSRSNADAPPAEEDEEKRGMGPESTGIVNSFSFPLSPPSGLSQPAVRRAIRTGIPGCAGSNPRRVFIVPFSYSVEEGTASPVPCQPLPWLAHLGGQFSGAP